MADRSYKTDNPVVEIDSTLGKIAVELFPKRPLTRSRTS